VDWHKALGWLRSQAGLDLAPRQQEAVKLALRSKVPAQTGRSTQGGAGYRLKAAIRTRKSSGGGQVGALACWSSTDATQRRSQHEGLTETAFGRHLPR
jgi:hypothetical protein